MVIDMLVIAIGVFATIVMDVWQRFLLLAFKIPAPEWKLVGRWVLGIPALGIVQKIPTELPVRRLENIAGWVVHYLVGILYGIGYTFLLERTSINGLWVTFFFAAISLVAPWLFLMPSMGMGFFAAKTPNPRLVRIYNVMSHLVFSFAMYVAVLYGATY